MAKYVPSRKGYLLKRGKRVDVIIQTPSGITEFDADLTKKKQDYLFVKDIPDIKKHPDGFYRIEADPRGYPFVGKDIFDRWWSVGITKELNPEKEYARLKKVVETPTSPYRSRMPGVLGEQEKMARSARLEHRKKETKWRLLRALERMFGMR
jgi:hypothetical protein